MLLKLLRTSNKMPLLDIFSKSMSKPIKEITKVKIIVDNREKNSLVPSILITKNFEVKFEQLPVADYILNDTAIERKTISDLKSSIINKRIFQQMLEIKQYKKYLLIIEGNTSELYNNEIIHENAIRGFLLSISLDYQVPIILAKNEEDTANYLSLLARKSSKEHSLRASKIFLSEKERLQFILEGFPNIGPVTAHKLLEHFHSLKNIANASQEELEKLIGKKAETLYKLINHFYS